MQTVTTTPKVKTRSATIGLSAREKERDSMARAIRASLNGKFAEGAPFEHQCSVATAHALGEPEPIGSFLVPDDALTLGRRELTTATASGLTQTDSPRDLWVGTLGDALVYARLGVDVRDGLKNYALVPVVTTPATAYWLSAEGTTQITPTQPVYGVAPEVPKMVAVLVGVSHQAVSQAPEIVDAELPREFATSIAAEMDANAGRQRFSSTDSPIWAGSPLDGSVCGCRAISSPSVPSATIIAGAWDAAQILTWGALQVGVDPYSSFRDGRLLVRAMLMVDVLIRRPSAFTVFTSVS